ncbi:AT-hook motif nuclear-localized protein 17 [Tanacetum coccineum]
MSTTTNNHQSPPPTTVNHCSDEAITTPNKRRKMGRPLGSKNKPKKPPVFAMQQPEQVMSPYVIEVSHGLDIVTVVTTFCNERDTGLCVLSGSGKVSYVSLKPPCCACYGASAPVVHEGCYELLSISATVLPPSSAMLTTLSNNDFLAKFVISISAGPGGQILGGVVEGPLIASGTVYIVASSFNNPSYHRFTMEYVKEDEDNARHSGGVGTNSGGRVKYPHSGSGSVSEAKGQLPKSGGGDYGGNYDAPSLSAAVSSLPMYTLMMLAD